jgi:hypothetical protein
MISEPSCFSDYSFDYPIERLNSSKWYLYVTIVENAFKVPVNQFHEFFKWSQTLPFELILPTFQKPQCPCTTFIQPEGTEYFLEVVGNIEALIQSKGFFQKTLLIICQIKPPAKKQPSLPTYQFPFLSTLPKELFSANLIDCIIEMAYQVELVENDFSVDKERFNACMKCFPHIHANYVDRLAERFTCDVKKGIQRDRLVSFYHPNNCTVFQITHDGVQVLLSAETDLIDSQPIDGAQRPAFSVILFQDRILYASSRVLGNFMFLCC